MKNFRRPAAAPEGIPARQDRPFGLRLPEPIGDVTHFVLGPVVRVHRIPELNIIIIQYHPEVMDNGFGTGKYDLVLSSFHLHGSSMSFDSLWSAIVWGIARFNKVDDGFARGACKLLDAEPVFMSL